MAVADAECPDRPVRVLVLVAARTIDAGPVKGCLQFIRYLSRPDLVFHLVNFRTGEMDPKVDAFIRAAADTGVNLEFVTERTWIFRARPCTRCDRPARRDRYTAVPWF